MKKFYNLLLLTLFTTVSFAQGISVQGIARDVQKAALGNKTLKFTFEIQQITDGSKQYEETQTITTDAFGVFSHIIGTGTPVESTFADIDYSSDPLKLIVKLGEETILDEPFNYTPYAAHASNGVPTGSIMPYTGATAPKGWLLCNGGVIPNITTSGKALKNLLGSSNTPNLQGMFLRGTGTSPVNSKAGPALNETQSDDNKEHKHHATITGGTTTDGKHSHTYSRLTQSSSGWSYDSGSYKLTHENNLTNTDGSHGHDVRVEGDTDNTGTESRPVNYGVNYIIKL